METESTKPVEATWDDSRPKDTWGNYGATGRLAVVLAGVTFGALFFPFIGTQWGLPVATLAAYSVLVFSLTFRDKNCSLRRPEVRDQLPKFAFMHLPFLLLVYGIEVGWLNVASSMPEWLTVRGRKGSFYDWILIASICLLAWGQEHWVRTIVRSNLRTD